MHREQIMVRLRTQRQQSLLGRETDLRVVKVKLTQAHGRRMASWRDLWRRR